MKLIQTTNKDGAMSLYLFFKRRCKGVKPFIFTQHMKFSDREYFSYAVGYKSRKKGDNKKVCLEKPFFKSKEIEDMVYRYKKFNY